MDDDLNVLPWAVHLPEQDRARLRQELDEWRATAEAYRDGHGEALSTPVDLVDYLRADGPDDYELPADVAANLESSRRAGPGRSGRPERRAHMDAARGSEAEGDGTELGEVDAQREYDENPQLRDLLSRAAESPTVRLPPGLYKRKPVDGGGYPSSSKDVSGLAAPPRGPAPGAPRGGDGTSDD